MHLASSILSSSAGGRIVTIRPEPSADFDFSIAHDIGGDQLELDAAEFSAAESWEAGSDFFFDPFPEYTRGSEALAVYRSSAGVGELPTQSRKYELGKRIFDITLAIVVSPIVAIMIAIIGGMIALTSGGPIFFRQRRIGQHGREFPIWKFRTMRPRAERILADYLKRNPSAREEWNHTHKLRDDPRITWLGRMLRKNSLDELPQLLNVFVGDMSFVGPRPIVWAEAFKYAERFPYYLAAVPGVTGLWQVSGRSDVTYEARTILAETYVCKWSLLRDILILLKTPRAVVNRDGAY